MAFNELLKKISPVLKKICYRLDGRYFFGADDLYQEAALHLWQAFNAGRIQDKTDSYILQGCYFHLKNYIRMTKVRVRALSLESFLPNKEGEESLEDILCARRQNNPKEWLDYLNNKLLAETIRNNGLAPKEKEILFLYADGLTTREIGAKFNMSHVGIIKAMRKIRAKCRKYCEDNL